MPISRNRLTTPDDDHAINMILYGDTGVGKTYLAGSAADSEALSPVLMIDVEGGTLTLAGKKNIDVFRPENWSDVQEAYNVLRTEDHKYRTVIIDSLTEVQRKLSLGFIMGDLQDDSDTYHDLGKTTPPDRQDWLRTGEQMRKFIRAFRDLSWQRAVRRRVHVIMTVLEKSDDKRRIICPELPGKLGPGAGAFVDILARLSVALTEDKDGVIEERRHLLVSSYEDARGTVYLAKNRGGRLGRQIWDPTAERILGVWADHERSPKDKRAEQEKVRRRKRTEPEADNEIEEADDE